jgi:GDP-L-fucose synthase
MVIGSLIRRIIEGENPLKVWGDGSNIRDFIYSEDVAEAMIQVIEKNINIPINIGSGKGTSIKNLVETIVSSKYIKNKPSILFDNSQPSGDKIRILDTSLANKHGISCNKNLKEGIDLTLGWYLSEKDSIKGKYNYFA